MSRCKCLHFWLKCKPSVNFYVFGFIFNSENSIYLQLRKFAVVFRKTLAKFEFELISAADKKRKERILPFGIIFIIQVIWTIISFEQKNNEWFIIIYNIITNYSFSTAIKPKFRYILEKKLFLPQKCLKNWQKNCFFIRF